jgi:transposase
MLEGGLKAVEADEDVVGTSRVRELERRVRKLEHPLGRKTMEVEILKEALDVARVKKPILPLRSQAGERKRCLFGTWETSQPSLAAIFQRPQNIYRRNRVRRIQCLRLLWCKHKGERDGVLLYMRR